MSLNSQQQLELWQKAHGDNQAERENAYRLLLQDFRGPAWRVLCRTLAAAGLGEPQAEEAWQCAVVKFFLHGQEQFRQEASLRNYFVRIALYAAIDLIREQKRLKPLNPEEEIEAEGLNYHFNPYDANEEDIDQPLLLIATLRSCLATLSDIYREAINLYYFENRGSCGECASLLQLTGAAFMQRLTRARKQLAQCVRRKISPSQDRLDQSAAAKTGGL